MRTAVHHGWITLEDLAGLLSENAARLFRLSQKGRLTAGADADLTIVDLSAVWTYDSAAALTKSRANMRIYGGVELHGRVVHTIVRGVPVCRDGVVIACAGECPAVPCAVPGLRPGRVVPAAVREAAVTLVVLDCLGHDDACRATCARVSDRPVVAVQGLVAHLAASMV